MLHLFLLLLLEKLGCVHVQSLLLYELSIIGDVLSLAGNDTGNHGTDCHLLWLLEHLEEVHACYLIDLGLVTVTRHLRLVQFVLGMLMAAL